MRRLLLIGTVAFWLLGCDSLGGDLRPNGSITPCGGHHTDSQACGIRAPTEETRELRRTRFSSSTATLAIARIDQS
jgi:hypothetical protein